MNELIRELINAGITSCIDLRKRVHDVKWINDYSITFMIDDKTYEGTLSGRNVNLIIGFGEEKDAAIALRVLFDGDAKLMDKQ
jgi:hypothetical protein